MCSSYAKFTLLTFAYSSFHPGVPYVVVVNMCHAKHLDATFFFNIIISVNIGLD
jgi:hypothetical protein